jgi:trehalose/maltose hydrolase-like predicted phosphorylase
MYPTLLALQPDMAKSCLDYRSDRLQKAKKQPFMVIKELCILGNLMGEEATPTWALTGILSNILLQMFLAFWNCVHTR